MNFSPEVRAQGVAPVQGSLSRSIVSMDRSAVDEASVRELISMFRHHGIDMRKLRELETKEFSIMDAKHIRLLVQVDVSGSMSA